MLVNSGGVEYIHSPGDSSFGIGPRFLPLSDSKVHSGINQHSWLENEAFEDVFRIENRDIPASYVSLPEGKFCMVNLEPACHWMMNIYPP